jgi:hypothetical protein
MMNVLEAWTIHTNEILRNVVVQKKKSANEMGVSDAKLSANKLEIDHEILELSARTENAFPPPHNRYQAL